MAMFSLECWNKLNDIKLTEKDVVLSDDVDLCEECGQYERVIIKYTRKWWEHEGGNICKGKFTGTGR